MLYIEDISALQYWLSTARVVHDGQKLQRLSALENCPDNSRESSWHTLDSLPHEFEDSPVLAVPSPEFRVQRKRFTYHVWTRPIPAESFMKVADDIAIACPALSLVQASRNFREEHIAQVLCSLAGSYMIPSGGSAGMIDELQPLVTLREVRDMQREMRGICSPRHLNSALLYAAENSASPGETKLLLLCTMPKTKGGLATRNWKMNVEMEVPFKLRRYLDQPTIKPDLISTEHDLILEYDSDERHSPIEQLRKDEKRRIVFEAMGYKVISVRTHHMRSAACFEPIAKETLSSLGRKRKDSTESELAARDLLLNSLRRNPLL